MTRLPLLLASVAACSACPAFAQSRQISPYIEAGQVLTADLQSGDVLTYSSLAAGVDASVQTQRVEVQLSYRYEHRVAWDDEIGDESVHSGLARAAVKLAPGLSVEGGALATRARTDIRGAAPGNLAGDPANVSQVYSAYAGPTYATRVGPATLNAAYRFGYTKVEDSSPTLVPEGQVPLDSYDDSRTHMAVASIGVRAGEVLPVGVTVSGAWMREDTGQLDQRYEGKYARGDVVLPVSPTVALTAGLGYENIEISQRDALLVPAGQPGAGLPVADSNGRFITDPASPRRLAYDTDGLFWDAGVIWRPSARTTVTARVGRRYDSTTYLGSISYAVSETSGLNVGVYDSVTSFGRGVNNAIASLPTSFNDNIGPFGSGYNSCVFGTQGSAAGNCLTPLLASVSTANFRARGVDAVFSANSGPFTFGIGGGYANRKFLVPLDTQASVLGGIDDDIYYAQFVVDRVLTPRSSVSGNVYANYFDSGLIGASEVFGVGANGSYNYSFGRFGAVASAGIYTSDQEGVGTDTGAQAQLGMRYSF